jgi:phosphatidate cytidylyltransferase
MFLPRFYSSLLILAVLFSIVIIKGVAGIIIFIFAGMFLSITATRELSLIFCKFGLNKFLYANEIFAAFVFVIFIFNGIYEPGIGLGILLLVIFIIVLWIKILLSFNKKDEILKVLNLISVFVILIIPMNFITLIFMRGYGQDYFGVKLIIFLILVTKFGDIGAYTIGTLTSKRKNGNHKIIPSISPKKSWEGAIGGLITSIAVSMIICWLYEFPMIMAIVFGSGLFIGGFAGDLAESSLKRCAGIKNSGSIIPGIGGVLDLIDSLLINALLFYILLLCFGIIS